MKLVHPLVLTAALSLGLPVGAAAQDQPPAPPQERPGAVRRPPPVAQPDPGPREAQAVERSAPASSPERAPAPERRYRSDDAAEAAARRATRGDSTASRDDEQDRRGAVRRPPTRGGDIGDRAVPRASVPRPRGPDRVYVYPDYWSYRDYNRYYGSGFGLGYLMYSPWGWTPAFYGAPYGAGGYGGGYASRGYAMGGLKLKVDQRDAEVWVDGYFAGYVDDFDGFFQSLKLEAGGYRIEVRKPGFETLHFDVHVQPDRTVTFRGRLMPAP